MVHSLKPKSFLEAASNVPIIDVRSPGEFNHGHIPGAINIPLFPDGERREIGILYKTAGRNAAISRGLELAGPRIPWYLKQARNAARGSDLLVHCWRGGMRSSGFAGLCEKAGLNVQLLEGGYKAYRRMIRDEFAESRQLILLSGMTGCGKTEILRALANLGEQVIDLEAIARHRGSAFGFIGQKKQPTNEQFENNTAAVWQTFDMSRRIWIEDESLRIGKVFVNEVLFEAMQSASIFEIEIPDDVRIDRLLRDYRVISSDELIPIVYKIQKRLGPERTRTVIRFLEQGNYADSIRELLKYYDKGYAYGVRKRKAYAIKLKFDIENSDPAIIAETLVNYVGADCKPERIAAAARIF